MWKTLFSGMRGKMTTIVISIVGHERAGKDFITSCLIGHFKEQGASVERFSNADALKDLAQNIFGIDRDTLEDMKIDKTNVELMGSTMPMRDALITISEKWVKPVFGNGVWAEVFKNLLKQTEADIIIKTDDRYISDTQPNPANTIYISIQRDGVTGIPNTPYYDTVNALVENANIKFFNNVDVSDPQFRQNFTTLIQAIKEQL